MHERGSLLAAVAAQVALTVAVRIHPADPAPAKHGSFPDPGVDDPALPLDVARMSDVHRQ